jgi:hypothetical protein
MSGAAKPLNARLLRPIHTSHNKPPIPTTDFDWCAIFDGYEPGDSIGHGPTEQEAIDWLVAEEAHLIATEHEKARTA